MVTCHAIDIYIDCRLKVPNIGKCRTPTDIQIIKQFLKIHVVITCCDVNTGKLGARVSGTSQTSPLWCVPFFKAFFDRSLWFLLNFQFT